MDLNFQRDLEEKLVDDPPYIQPISASDLGVYIEYYICKHFGCPICGEKLYKYINPNHPVIDIVCTSLNNHPIKFFQVKTTQEGSIIPGEPRASEKYFDIKFNNNYIDSYIHVGSYNYGKIIHEIKPSDSTDLRRMLIGYICIEYTKNEADGSFTILGNNSYCIYPNATITTLGEYYYKYIRIQSKNKSAIITFDKKNMTIIKIKDVYKWQNSNLVIKIQEQFQYKINDSTKITYSTIQMVPLSVATNNKYLQKYYKYKKKYLLLKNMQIAK